MSSWDHGINIVLANRKDLQSLQAFTKLLFEKVKNERAGLGASHSRHAKDMEYALERCIEELQDAIGEDSDYTGEDFTYTSNHPDFSTWQALTRADERRAN